MGSCVCLCNIGWACLLACGVHMLHAFVRPAEFLHHYCLGLPSPVTPEQVTWAAWPIRCHESAGKPYLKIALVAMPTMLGWGWRPQQLWPPSRLCTLDLSECEGVVSVRVYSECEVV